MIGQLKELFWAWRQVKLLRRQIAETEYHRLDEHDQQPLF